MTDTEESIAIRYNRILERINNTVYRAGRPQGSVKLLVVTKGQPANKIMEAYRAGARLFGENYPDETAEKLEQIQTLPDIQIHMIGHLQSRKARIVAKAFQYIHSIDRVSIAEKLNRELQETGRKLPILLEMNVSGEETKGGFAAWEESSREQLLQQIAQIGEYPNLQINGLMTMPPLFDHPEDVRPFFARLRSLRDYLAVQFPRQRWNELSMGTSADFEIAIQEGATFIRVGTAIMGHRPMKNISI
ncbi:MAG: YggS family pyridoxal phosphate-dependent enzyme [Leptolinea sp.]|jgi:pyridoxal phosphate enzyme (YggS family)|nr:YggS family pyridoxal phosphate-dependent enzyme [Leptolinea sp.]